MSPLVLLRLELSEFTSQKNGGEKGWLQVDKPSAIMNLWLLL